MSRIGRLAGAMWAETGGAHYLVGNPKVPCDFAAAGFEPPIEIDAKARPYIRLSPIRAVEVAPPYLDLDLDLEGEALARLAAQVFVIERTGSVSERLWRLVRGETDEDDTPPAEITPARWMAEMPQALWRVIRDTVLKCT
jgi:hypothetical protein